MATRRVTYSDDVIQYLAGFEERSRRLGIPHALIEDAAGAIVLILNRRMKCPSFPIPYPVYQGKDPQRLGYSLYSFLEQGVSGIYTSNGVSVHLLSIEVDPLFGGGEFEEPPVAWGRSA